MSKLEFYCNRPTVVALINFGFELSSSNTAQSDPGAAKASNVEASMNKEKAEEHGKKLVKGFLGHGKGRVVFYLNMNVDSVTIFLNNEDGSQLAMFAQEHFLLDIKVCLSFNPPFHSLVT